MTNSDFMTTLTVDQTPEKVFNAIKNVRRWWSGLYSEEIKGFSEKINDEFTFRAGGGAHYSRQKLIEEIPGKRIVWQVTDSELSFLKMKNEWTGTKLIFEITQMGNKTQVVFIHEGLVPAIECYESCAPAWSKYIHDKLLPLINSKSTQIKGN